MDKNLLKYGGLVKQFPQFPLEAVRNYLEFLKFRNGEMRSYGDFDVLEF